MPSSALLNTVGAVLCGLSAVLSIGPVILLIWQGRRAEPASEAVEAPAPPRRYSAAWYRAQQIAPALVILLWTGFVLLCSLGVMKAIGG